MNEKLSMEELNRLDIETFKQCKKLPLIVILDNVRSMNNVGSIFRTSDAFRIEHVYLCGITAQPPHKEIEKTALGATESIDWSYVESTASLVTQLKKENYRVYAVEQVRNSIPLTDFTSDFSHQTAVVFGNEVMGVEQNVIDLCYGCIEIPQLGTKHSLNISVSAGIVLWHLFYMLTKK